jgi:hypothetical protein
MSSRLGRGQKNEVSAEQKQVLPPVFRLDVRGSEYITAGKATITPELAAKILKAAETVRAQDAAWMAFWDAGIEVDNDEPLEAVRLVVDESSFWWEGRDHGDHEWDTTAIELRRLSDPDPVQDLREDTSEDFPLD